MASFFSALLGSYSQTAFAKKQAELQREDQAKQNEIGVLSTAMSSGKLTDEGYEAAMNRVEELTATKGKKGQQPMIRTVLQKLRGQIPKDEQYQAQNLESTVASKPPKTAVDDAGNPVAGPKPHAFMTGDEMAAAKGRQKLAEEGPLQDRLEAQRQAAEDRRFKQQQDTEETRFKQQQELQSQREDAEAARAELSDKQRQFQENQREVFQERMERLRSAAASARQLRSAGLGDDKQLRTTMNNALNNNMTALRSQYTAAASQLRALRQSLSSSPIWSRIGGVPSQVATMQQQVDSIQKAIQYIESKRGAILSGSADMDDVIDQANQIMIVGADPSGLDLKPVESAGKK